MLRWPQRAGALLDHDLDKRLLVEVQIKRYHLNHKINDVLKKIIHLRKMINRSETLSKNWQNDFQDRIM